PGADQGGGIGSRAQGPGGSYPVTDDRRAEALGAAGVHLRLHSRLRPEPADHLSSHGEAARGRPGRGDQGWDLGVLPLEPSPRIEDPCPARRTRLARYGPGAVRLPPECGTVANKRGAISARGWGPA